jgi:aspartyl protease family protein
MEIESLMDGTDAPNTFYLLLLLMLVGSSLVAMRLPLAKAARMALAWVAIFGATFALFSFRSEFSALGARLKAEAIGEPVVAGGELRIPMADDGHFWVDASVNGHEAPFLVDSGASVTTISRAIASEAGVETGIRVAMVETANGVVEMRPARADRFDVGPIARTDFGIQVNEHDESNVLGMNFLSSLGSWRVEGNYLILKP